MKKWLAAIVLGAIVLQYFGFNVSQAEAKAALRTNPKDSNVFTYEIRD